MDIVIASNNQGKIKEIKDFYKKLKINFFSLKDFPALQKIKEGSGTYEKNAIQKAIKVSEFTRMISLADDSGIEIDALGGKPGIVSARFAGKGISDRERNLKILKLLENIPESSRKAKFVCIIAIVKPDRSSYIVKGICKGMIAKKPRGKSGFGYDPIFIFPRYNKTFAEMGIDLKNRISHRGKALRKAEKILERILKNNHSSLLKIKPEIRQKSFDVKK